MAGTSPPPLQLSYIILLDLVRKNDLGLWFCFLLEEGRFRRFWPKKRSFPAILGPKSTFNPPLIFFKFPLMYDIVHFVKKPKLGLWFCNELEEVRL